MSGRCEYEYVKKENERLEQENKSLRESIAYYKGYRAGVETLIDFTSIITTVDVQIETENTSNETIKDKINNPKEVEVEAKREEPQKIKFSDLKRKCEENGFIIEEDK